MFGLLNRIVDYFYPKKYKTSSDYKYTDFRPYPIPDGVVDYINGDKKWFKNGNLHRLDGPAVEYANENKEWWVDGKRHRLDGPAAEYYNGSKEWYQNGILHRLDGPAIEWFNGFKEWWHDGERVTDHSQEEFEKYLKSIRISKPLPPRDNKGRFISKGSK